MAFEVQDPLLGNSGVTFGFQCERRGALRLSTVNPTYRFYRCDLFQPVQHLRDMDTPGVENKIDSLK